MKKVENLTSLRVSSGETRILGSVEGNLLLEDGAIIVAENDLISVNGKILSEGKATIKGNLSATTIVCEGTLEVNGNLTVSERVGCEQSLVVSGILKVGDLLLVGDECRVKGDVTLQDAKIGGRVVMDGKIAVHMLKVSGTAEINEIIANEVLAGGRIVIRGTSSNVELLKAGAGIELFGGRYQSVKTSGYLRVNGHVNFGAVFVGGTLEGSGEITAETIKIGNKMKYHGFVQVRSLKIGGMAEITGDLACDEEVSIGGRLTVLGNAQVGSLLKVGGSIAVKGVLECAAVIVGGQLKARKVLGREVHVGGLVQVSDYLRTTYFVIGKKGQVEGLVVADEIIVQEEASVIDLIGSIIHLKKRARVHGKVQYVESLLVEDDVQLEQAPEQIEQLPTLEYKD